MTSGDATINLLSMVHSLSANSKWLEDKLTSALENSGDYDGPRKLQIIEMNTRLLETLGQQRVLLEKMTEYILEMEDNVDKVISKVKKKETNETRLSDV